MPSRGHRSVGRGDFPAVLYDLADDGERVSGLRPPQTLGEEGVALFRVGMNSPCGVYIAQKAERMRAVYTKTRGGMCWVFSAHSQDGEQRRRRNLSG